MVQKRSLGDSPEVVRRSPGEELEAVRHLLGERKIQGDDLSVPMQKVNPVLRKRGDKLGDLLVQRRSPGDDLAVEPLVRRNRGDVLVGPVNHRHLAKNNHGVDQVADLLRRINLGDAQVVAAALALALVLVLVEGPVGETNLGNGQVGTTREEREGAVGIGDKHTSITVGVV